MATGTIENTNKVLQTYGLQDTLEKIFNTGINTPNSSISSARVDGSSPLFGFSSATSIPVFLWRYSSSNIHYLAWNRYGISVGNINKNSSNVYSVTEKNSVAFTNKFVTGTVQFKYNNIAPTYTAHTNLKTLIDNDINTNHAGASFFCISGVKSGFNAMMPSNFYYANDDYSLTLKNVGSSTVDSEKTCVVDYICILP